MKHLRNQQSNNQNGMGSVKGEADIPSLNYTELEVFSHKASTKNANAIFLFLTLIRKVDKIVISLNTEHDKTCWFSQQSINNSTIAP